MSNCELPSGATKPEFDLSVLDEAVPTSQKKRVSFGKVFRKSKFAVTDLYFFTSFVYIFNFFFFKEYSSKSCVVFNPPKLTKPDRGILRR